MAFRAGETLNGERTHISLMKDPTLVPSIRIGHIRSQPLKLTPGRSDTPGLHRLLYSNAPAYVHVHN